MDIGSRSQVWTAQQTAQLIELWADDGLPASMIAEKIIGGCFSRNAVLGKANRMIRAGQLAPRGNSSTEQSARYRRTHVSPSLGMRRRRKRPPHKAWSPPQVTEIPFSMPLAEPEFQCVEPDMPRLTIWELTDKTCRWPLDDPPEHAAVQTYCGKPHIGGSAYCMFHFLKSRNPRHA